MVLNSPKGFLWDLFQRSHFFISVDNLKTWLPIHWCPSPLHLHGSMPSKQSEILSVYQTHVFAIHMQIEDWLHLKKLLNSNWKQRIELQWQLSSSSWCCWQSFFSKLCKCIYMSKPCHWNQVCFNHLIQSQQPISDPKNKPSCEPSYEQTKRMDLDVELLKNLLSNKTWVMFSNQVQDNEIQSNSTDLTNTQTCGLCHNKKSEPESLAEQPIAVTDSSKY